MKIKSIQILILSSLLLVGGCYPIGPEFVEDYDAVYTVIRDNEFDFSQPNLQTFYLPDTVMVLTDPNSSETNITINKNSLLGRVRTNMLNAGYTEETDSNNIDNVDYVVLVSVSRSDNYIINWWWGWGPWWGFPPAATTTNIRTGSLLVELVDYQQLKNNPQLMPIVWLGMGEGLFRGSDQNLNNRSTRAIDQMFIQSPYLKR